MSIPLTVRDELGRLILAGLGGRTVSFLWGQTRRAFVDHGESIAWDTFLGWVSGDSFPASQKRQDLLGDVVGGKCGAQIKLLKAPPFRGRRRTLMEKKDMSKPREFLTKSRMHGDRRVPMAEIICHACPDKHRDYSLCHGDYDHVAFFEKRGWEVGRTPSGDRCPQCVARKAGKPVPQPERKVVHMSDHKKPPPEERPADEPRIMTREDGRLISRAIEDHWDKEDKERYQPGWSDRKIAEDYGCPVEWVQAIRERDFGGVGEDPDVHEFIARLNIVVAQASEIEKHHTEYLSSSSSLESKLADLKQEVAREGRNRENVRDKTEKLRDEVRALVALAENFQRPFSKAG